MYELASSVNRKLVMEPAYAYILYQMEGMKSAVYLPGDNFPSYLKEMGEIEVVSDSDILGDPGHFLLQNSYSHILSLIYFEGIKGRYFHLFGEPLVKGEKHWQIMLNVVEKAGFEFRSFSNLYSFSHAYPNHLSWLINTVGAPTVVAVHSGHPENLYVPSGVQFFPDESKEYVLKEGYLKEAEIL